MRDFDRYKYSLELLLELIINHQRISELRETLNKICSFYDNEYQTTSFGDLLKIKEKQYLGLLLNDEDLLFISEAHTPILVKNGDLISSQEKLLIYITIQYWVFKYKLTDVAIYKKLASPLNISNDLINTIEFYFFTPEKLTISKNFLFLNCNNQEEEDQLEGLWIEENKPEDLKNVFEKDVVNNTMYAALLIENENCFVVHCRQSNKQSVKNDTVYPDELFFVEPGDKIKINNIYEINYVELKRRLISYKFKNKIYLSAHETSFSYRNQKGVSPFNFIGQTGELIGIMGNEGAGKSTILKILAGRIHPDKGHVSLNGYNLKRNFYQLSGYIGYVPEEDLLYPELSVYENILIAAQLYTNLYGPVAPRIKVEELLKGLQLWHIKDVKVGKSSEKRILPGQRRLLNIALELVREPKILIIDNAISALSINDSTSVVHYLSKLSFQGRLIITTITQSNKSTFENFDKIFLISDNGVPFYFNDKDKVTEYFSKKIPSGLLRKIETSEFVKPEVILEIFNQDIPRYFKDSVSNNLSYQNYLENSKQALKNIPQKKKLPKKKLYSPRLEKQYIIFSLRNFKTKLSRRKELTFSLLAAPIIACILSLILKNSDGSTYYFGKNPNIPSFFYLSIMVVFTLGLLQSSREVLRERFVLQREENLNLSMFSYYNSKITYLFIIIGFQTLFFTITSNLILEIKGMFIYHWPIYYSISATGILLGLAFSSTHSQYESILNKTIPITFIIFLLLGGGYIPLNNLGFTKGKSVPLISEFAVNKWAYESIMVNQFSKNPYQINFNDADQIISYGSFISYHLLPAIRENLDFIDENLSSNPDSTSRLLSAIQHKFLFFENTENIFPFEYTDSLTPESYSHDFYEDAVEYLSYLDYYFWQLYSEGITKRTIIADSIKNTLNVDPDVLNVKHNNNAVSQLVRNTSARERIKFIGNTYTQMTDPIFQPPENNYGRTLLFLPEKKFNNQIIPTYQFNVSVIWLFNFSIYILLITNVLDKFKKAINKQIFKN